MALGVAGARAISGAGGVLGPPSTGVAYAPTDVIADGHATSDRTMSVRVAPGPSDPRPSAEAPLHLTDGRRICRGREGVAVEGYLRPQRAARIERPCFVNRVTARNIATGPVSVARPHLLLPHEVGSARIRAT